MNRHLDNEIHSNKPLMYFGGYCFGGISLISYLAYLSFSKASKKMLMDRPAGERLKLSKMSLYNRIWQAELALGIWFAGFLFLAYYIDLGDRVFQSCIKKDDDYTNRIKLDPFFQKFYIINTMHYFGISEGLIKKTEE